MKNCPAIALIEDDDDIRQSYAEILEAEGYSVRQYRNGREAMEGLKDCSEPCLIFLDLMMPIMDGWEFLEHRKELGDAIVAVPVYIVTAVDERSKMPKYGVKGYIKKPIDLDVLLKIAQGYCRSEAAA